MSLNKLGWSEKQEEYIRENDLSDFHLARVSAVHKDRYVLNTPDAEYNAEIIGNIRYSAREAADFPIVGDWVAIQIFDNELAIIHKILPRSSLLERQAVGRSGEKQPIATNVDGLFIIQSLDEDFSINRLERYLAISIASGIEPFALLSKTDLVKPEKLNSVIKSIEKRHPKLVIMSFSNNTNDGYAHIESTLTKGKTYCFLGSSGVGKSTLTNYLLGTESMKTRSISTSTGKGKHTTSHRELFILENEAIVIDTPGMREVGIVEGVEDSFDIIQELAAECKYSDCTHTQEDGCLVLQALLEEQIEQASYDNYIKMQKEAAHFQASMVEKRRKDKGFGKMIKQVLKNKNDNKY